MLIYTARTATIICARWGLKHTRTFGPKSFQYTPSRPFLFLVPLVVTNRYLERHLGSS